MKKALPYSHFNSTEGFFIAFIIIAGSCSTEAVPPFNTNGTWQTLGLSGEHVNVLKTSGQAVYAATDSDLFRGTFSAKPEWSALELKNQMVEGEWVRDFMVYNESEIFGRHRSRIRFGRYGVLGPFCAFLLYHGWRRYLGTDRK